MASRSSGSARCPITRRPRPPRWSAWAVPVSADNDWFDLTITVTVGGEEVPFAELFVALAGGQSHLILPSGTFFSLDREELRELAQLIAEARGLHDDARRRDPPEPLPGEPVGGLPAPRGGHRPGQPVGGLSTRPGRMRSIGTSTGPPPHCAPRSGRTSTPDSTGWPFSTSTGSAAFWPTTWGLARRCRRWH